MSDTTFFRIVKLNKNISSAEKFLNSPLKYALNREKKAVLIEEGTGREEYTSTFFYFIFIYVNNDSLST